MKKWFKYGLGALLAAVMLNCAAPALADTPLALPVALNNGSAISSVIIPAPNKLDICAVVEQLNELDEPFLVMPTAYPLINTGSEIKLVSNPAKQPVMTTMVSGDNECYMLEPYVDAYWHKVMIDGQTGYISTAYLDASDFSYAYKFDRGQDMRIRTGYTAEQLEVYLRDGMSGLGEAYADAEAKYGVNALFMIAICRIESVNGNSGLARNKNNLAGIGGPGGWRSFESKEACVYYLAEMLGTRYLSPDGSLYRGSTISGVSSYYCGGSGTWITNVGNAMQWCWEAILAAEEEKAAAE